MNLANLFQGHRHNESISLFGLKILTMIIIIACLTGYLAVVIIEVNQDAPITITSFINAEGIRPPNLHFTSSYNISFLDCNEVYAINSEFTPIVCTEETSVVFDEKSNFYFGSYQPSKDVFLGENAAKFVLLIISINEQITFEKSVTMELFAFDPEYDLTGKSNLSKYDNTIYTMNQYTIEPSQAYVFSYTRTIKELVIPSWMNDFGVPPTYERKPIISSNLVGRPLLQIKGAEGAIQFNIQPKSANVVQVDRDVRSHTYLGGLGLVGGAWGLGAAIYAFLFGADALRPWGAVHLYCCGFSRSVQKKIKNGLPIIPFFDTSNPKFKDQPKKDLTLAEQNELLLLLQSRFDSLELFLQEYVIDVRFLDKIRKPNQSKHNDDNNNNDAKDKQDKNLVSIRTIQSQQEESIMITMPPNLAQNSTTDNSSTTNTTYTADTADTSQDYSSRQQNTLTQQQ